MVTLIDGKKKRPIIRAIKSVDNRCSDVSFEVNLETPPPTPTSSSSCTTPPSTPEEVEDQIVEHDTPISRYRRENDAFSSSTPTPKRKNTSLLIPENAPRIPSPGASFEEEPAAASDTTPSRISLNTKIALEIEAAQRVASSVSTNQDAEIDDLTQTLIVRALNHKPRWNNHFSATSRRLHPPMRLEPIATEASDFRGGSCHVRRRSCEQEADNEASDHSLLDEDEQTSNEVDDTPSPQALDELGRTTNNVDNDATTPSGKDRDESNSCCSSDLSIDDSFFDEKNGGGDVSLSTSKASPERARSPDDLEKDPIRKARFANSVRSKTNDDLKLDKSLSITESDVGELDGLPLRVRSLWLSETSRREKILQSLDGIHVSPPWPRSPEPLDIQLRPSRSVASNGDDETAEEECSDWFFGGWPMNFFFGSSYSDKEAREDNEQEDANMEKPSHRTRRWTDDDDTLALLGCANIIHREDRVAAVPTCLVKVTSEPPFPSYGDIHAAEVDPRLQSWVDNQFSVPERLFRDGSYQLGKSRTVIVHEIARGNWTWCTEWSPDGSMLAVATENHHLAVVDTTSSTVWRVRHDKRITGRIRNDTTHSIRCIAWGANYIAVGGTGNAVSILSPTEPYPILHTIKGTGFVGSLSWKPSSSVLAIASRLDRAMIVRVGATGYVNANNDNKIESEVLHTINREDWVHSVAFSPGGMCLAVSDAGGNLLVYNYLDEPNKPVELSLIEKFELEDATLVVEWSPDGRWLYAGGEDFCVTVIETRYWEIVHKIKRERWVHTIAASKGGTHVAVGGAASEISILDANAGWDSVIGVELNGLFPLSAKWHPKDQYLSVTGQNNSIIVVETTNARHVKGHHLHSISPIMAIEFSPDGRMSVFGNENGVVTFYSLSGSTFVTSYELIVMLKGKLSIRWSLNGLYTAIGSKDTLLIVGRRKRDRSGKKLPPAASSFSVRKVIDDMKDIAAVCIDFQSQYVAVSGKGTWILDAAADFSIVREFTSGLCLANAWSPDGRWLATIGEDKKLTIYDTSEEQVARWRPVFSIAIDYVGRALAWSPLIVGGLLYLAYGGDAQLVTVMEIRPHEGTWETVLRVQRAGSINALDWNIYGLLAAGISNGTVSIIDLSYLQSGVAVNEMDYKWQRQALTCFTEIRRNRGKNSMRTARWIPSAPGSDSLLAVGGTDGEVEIIDLTERASCGGYV